MAAGTIFLIRETQIFIPYTGCTNVEVTSTPVAYGSVTGLETTDVISVPGSTPVEGDTWVFTALVGGSSLTTGVRYFVRDVSGSDFKLAEYQGGPAIGFTTDITSGSSGLLQPSEILIWSSEFRDIFTPIGFTLSTAAFGGTQGASLATMSAALALDPVLEPAVGSPSTPGYISGTPVVTNSDEIGHVPLRQTLLPRSYWKFIMEAGPAALYAEVLPGDVLSNNAPNSVPTV